jgi:hypothetical protein
LDNLLFGLISSKTRVKLLIRFFFNPQTRSYLRELAKEFDVSTNSVRDELNQFTRTRLLKSEPSGRNVFHKVNAASPLRLFFYETHWPRQNRHPMNNLSDVRFRIHIHYGAAPLFLLGLSIKSQGRLMNQKYSFIHAL